MSFITPFTVTSISCLFLVRVGWMKSSVSAPFLMGTLVSWVFLTLHPFVSHWSNPAIGPWARRRAAAAQFDGIPHAVMEFVLNDAYGLEQRIINTDNFYPETMWVNHGSWKNQNHSYPQAGNDLFKRLLQLAEITPYSKINILEAGAGCADAALYLHKHYPQAVATYTGININKLQNEFALGRLNGLPVVDTAASKPRYASYVADAAHPSTWPTNLQERVVSQPGKHSPRGGGEDAERTWVLAIDSLYLLDPSPTELLKFANQDLGASLMASDIVIADDASWFQSRLLRMLLILMEVPPTNVWTQSEYLTLIHESGYSKESIVVVDDTENCFAPYVVYFKKHLDRLEAMGYAWDVTFVYRMGTFMIDLASKTGKLKHLLVVARA